jgi:hypothetical protein
MKEKKIAILGTGFISDFYISTLHGTRARDRAIMAYSRSEERAEGFAKKWDIPKWSTNTTIAINEKVIEDKITSGVFHKLERTFSNNDIVTVTFPMKVTTTNWPNNGL